jgi:spore coat-associated protein N
MRHDHHTAIRRRLRSRRATAVVAAVAIAAAGVATALAAAGGGDSGGISMALRAAGNASIGNSKGNTGQAIFATPTNLKPGGSALATVTITNTGDPSTFTLSKSHLQNVSGAIAGVLNLRVVDEANPGTPIYDGLLTNFASGGPVSLGPAWAHNEAHTYDFTVSLPHTVGNDQQGASATVDFNWGATALDTGGGGTTSTATTPPATDTGSAASNPPANNPTFIPSGGGSPAPPNVTLGGSTTQFTTDGYSLVLACSQACTVNIGGTANVPGASRVFRLPNKAVSLRAGVRTTVKYQFPRAIALAVKKAIARNKRVTVSVKLNIRNAAGASRNSARTIVLKKKR